MRSPRAAARSVAAAFPRRHGHPSLRLGRPAAPALAQSAFPPLRLPPSAVFAPCRPLGGVALLLSPLRLARCSPRARALQAAARPLPSCAPSLPCGVGALPSCAPFPPRAAPRPAAGRPRGSRRWARPRRAGGLRVPPCRPFGLRCASAPSAGPCCAGFARAFLCLRAPPRKGFLSPLRRRRGDAAAAAFLRRLRVCEASLRSSVYSEQLSERATTERLLILSGE